jgi:hypothetical protein
MTFDPDLFARTIARHFAKDAVADEAEAENDPTGDEQIDPSDERAARERQAADRAAQVRLNRKKRAKAVGKDEDDATDQDSAAKDDEDDMMTEHTPEANPYDQGRGATAKLLRRIHKGAPADQRKLAFPAISTHTTGRLRLSLDDPYGDRLRKSARESGDFHFPNGEWNKLAKAAKAGGLPVVDDRTQPNGITRGLDVFKKIHSAGAQSLVRGLGLPPQSRGAVWDNARGANDGGVDASAGARGDVGRDAPRSTRSPLLAGTAAHSASLRDLQPLQTQKSDATVEAIKAAHRNPRPLC